MNVRDFAESLLDLCDEVDALRHENARLQKIADQFGEFLSESIHESQKLNAEIVGRLIDRAAANGRPAHE